VARELSAHKIVYDALTFEEGMKSIEEIKEGLKESALFVLFISDAALKSKWVREELTRAYDLLTEGNLKRIYPIIIDSNIDYLDTRIPQWMRDEYNLKYVSRPTIASRRIRQRLLEISWDIHPRLREKEEIFVGRNDLIKIFEERIDAIDRPAPICFIASGVNRIGRKALLKNCFKKTGLIRKSYSPPQITLSSQESIEDFIFKMHDLGFSEKLDLTNFMTRTLSDKLDVAIKLTLDIQKAKEILFIEDNGCIITDLREISSWFLKLLEEFKNSEKITFAISAPFRLHKNLINKKDFVFALDVPELDKSERIGLLKRYSEFEQLEMTYDDFKFFEKLLTGFPEQVFFTVDMIKDIGLPVLKRQSFLIVEYNKEKINHLMQKYDKDQNAIDFLAFLAEFDFINYDFIFEIVGTDINYTELLNEFIATAICEFLGANNEYVRLNDAVRDFISRVRLQMPEKYKTKLKEHLEFFLSTYTTEEKDSFDFFFSLKEAIKSGREIDSRFLIPSHFVKTMQELYDVQNKYGEVIRLADRVLKNEEYMHESIKKEIRYYLCLSLARTRDARFLTEIQNIKGPDHEFLFGFYYRLTGQFTKALERLSKVLSDNKARREMVQVLINTEDYEGALELARQNYEGNKSNPYHIHAFLLCLIKQQSKDAEAIKLMESLLERLRRIPSERANQMYMNSYAQYLAFIKSDECESLNVINAAIQRYKSIIYPKLQKFDICDKFNRIKEMDEVLKSLEDDIDPKSHLFNSVIVRRAFYLAKIGKKDAAKYLVSTKLRNFPEISLEKISQKIDRYS
jgi:hypothetical protein